MAPRAPSSWRRGGFFDQLENGDKKMAGLGLVESLLVLGACIGLGLLMAAVVVAVYFVVRDR